MLKLRQVFSILAATLQVGRVVLGLLEPLRHGLGHVEQGPVGWLERLGEDDGADGIVLF